AARCRIGDDDHCRRVTVERTGGRRRKTRGERHPMTEVQRRHGWGVAAYAMLYLLFLYAPVLLLPLFSFNDSVFIAFPLSGFTGKWYSVMAADEDMRIALFNSLKVGIAASLASTLLGLTIAQVLTRGIPGRRL